MLRAFPTLSQLRLSHPELSLFGVKEQAYNDSMN